MLADRILAPSEIPPAPLAKIDVVRPIRQTSPLVLSSPHSGHDYPAEFVAGSRLDSLSLRLSEDMFVDEIFAAAPDFGAPLLKALFPRAYCDVNREPYELDPSMFADDLPAFANTTSPRVAGGLGTIARVVSNGAEIYPAKLRFAEAERRIEQCWRPYHHALGELLADTQCRFGAAILIDCHSMPSIGGPMDRDPGRYRPDIVLGDRHGRSCAPLLIDTAERALKDAGLNVVRNVPYAGGYTTQHYGRPGAGIHGLQIEINRAIYVDERRVERHTGFAAIVNHVSRLIATLAALDAADFSPHVR
jgi:N-formylglutamate amidohydrolase